jgi:hypothetical protein
VCFMRICDYKFAVYGFFAEHNLKAEGWGQHDREEILQRTHLPVCYDVGTRRRGAVGLASPLRDVSGRSAFEGSRELAKAETHFHLGMGFRSYPAGLDSGTRACLALHVV